MTSKKRFEGTAVHPKKVLLGQRVILGVWLGRKISQSQKRRLMELNTNELFAQGHIGVQVDDKTGTTVVKYLAARVKNQKTVRHLTVTLMRIVRETTGTGAILLRLSNCRAVSRALAV